MAPVRALKGLGVGLLVVGLLPLAVATHTNCTVNDTVCATANLGALNLGPSPGGQGYTIRWEATGGHEAAQPADGHLTIGPNSDSCFITIAGSCATSAEYTEFNIELGACRTATATTDPDVGATASADHEACV